MEAIPVSYLTVILVLSNMAWSVVCFYLIMVNQNILANQIKKRKR